MVVLMDPMEDPDDILRAHRSREKSYLFDVAFDFTATQVREGLGPGTHRGSLSALGPAGKGALRGPCHQTSACPPPLALWLLSCRIPIRVSLLCGHTVVSPQMPPDTGTPTAPPAGGPYRS